MFDPDTDARRMLVRERLHMLALDALRPEPAHVPSARDAGRGRRRRADVLLARLALLGRAFRPVSPAQGGRRRTVQGGGQQ